MEKCNGILIMGLEVRFVRYWGSKRKEIFAHLIQRHSKPGSIILDPMGGKGIAVVEGLKLQRKVIYNDLNPYAFFVTKTLISHCSSAKFKENLDVLMKKIFEYKILNDSYRKEPLFDWLYSTNCKCGRRVVIRHVLWTLLYRKKNLKGKDLLMQLNTRQKIVKIAIKLFNLIPRKTFSHAELIEQVKRNSSLRRVRGCLISLAINDMLVRNGLLKIIGERPLIIRYQSCCSCGLKERKAVKSDLQHLQKIRHINVFSGYPRDELKYTTGKPFYKRRRASKLDELFTKRNLLALSILRKEIKNLRCEENVKDALMLCFSCIIRPSSKMQGLNGGSSGIASYWIPPVHLEKNVLMLFYLRCKDFIRWIESNNFNPKIGKITEVLEGKVPVALFCKDARKLPIPNDTIDYVLVDPPQTDEIQYFELSFLPCRWLELKIPFKKEIIVNPRQDKDEKIYWAMMKQALTESVRVLKPEGRITILLHGEDKKYYETFNRLIKDLGLKFISKIFKSYEFKNNFHAKDKNRLNGDFYLTLEKLE